MLGNSKGLADAEFILLDKNDRVFTGFENTENMFSENKADALILRTDEEGIIKLDGIRADKYKLKEVKAPKGYRLPLEKDSIIEIEDTT